MMRILTTLRVVSVLLFAVVILDSVPPLYAQWSEVDGGVLISTGVDNLYHMIPDGQGGAWIAYDVHSVYTANTYLQRVDNDGVKLFGDDRGISIGPGDRNIYLGLLAADSGAVWVTYLNDTIRPGYDWSVYAQKVNLDGSFVYDTTGVLVVMEYQNQGENLTYNPMICSDGAGGFWQAYRINDNDHHLCIAGLNADGTQKVEDGTLLHDDFVLDYYQVGVGSDGMGGAWIIWEDPDHNNRSYCQRINANGECVFEEALLAINYETGSGDFYSVEPDGEGGAFFSFGDTAVLLQHMSNEGEREWGGSGIVSIFLGQSAPSSLLPMPDGSFVVTTARAPYSANLIRFEPDGSPYYDSLEIALDTYLERYTGYRASLNSTCCPDGSGGVFTFFGWDRVVNSSLEPIVRIHRVTDEGSLFWGTDTVEIALSPVAVHRAKSVANEADNEAILSILKGRGGSGELWLYKVLGDGRIAGRDTEVREHEDHSDLPAKFHILNAWPNPFNSTTKVQVVLPTSGPYSFLVYDRLGRQVFSEYAWLAAGYTEWDWTPATSLSSGLYFLCLRSVQEVTEPETLLFLK